MKAIETITGLNKQEQVKLYMSKVRFAIRLGFSPLEAREIVQQSFKESLGL